jgi:hypothetical protein
MSDEWKSWYGEVVWVKNANFPWWPCYVYDPMHLPIELVKKKSLKEIGKKYVVYFYADSNYTWVAKSAMKPYNETKALLKGQTVSKRYVAEFKKSIDIADAEVQRDKEGRVKWHYVAPSSSSAAPEPATDGVPATAAEPPEPVKKKRGRSKRCIAQPEGESRPGLEDESESESEVSAPTYLARVPCMTRICTRPSRCALPRPVSLTRLSLAHR